MKAWFLGASVVGLIAQLLVSCSSEGISPDDAATGGRRDVPPPTGDSGAGGEVGALPGSELRVPVGTDEPTYVSLRTAEVLELSGDPKESDAWDLAFQGYGVFTNGGLSGNGAAWSFGPVPYYYLYFPDDPIDVPLRVVDQAGGAFLRWYAYDGGDHTLYSRFHVYGVRAKGRTYKFQIVSYRGEVQGAPLNALYRIRYAEVTEAGSGELVDVSDIDATANGDALNPDEPSGCIALESQEQFRLTPAEAQASEDWDLCFRRDAISVNGGIGGPGDVEAVDLDADDTELETLDEVSELTAAAELERLDRTDYAALDAPELEYRGDSVTSAFTGRWYREGDPRTPEIDAAWMVAGPDGQSRYFIAFTRFIGADADTPGTVVLRVQAIAGP